MTQAAHRPRIGLTLGDAAGIGPEVAVKALHLTQMAEHCKVYVFVAAEILRWAQDLLGPRPVRWRACDLHEFDGMHGQPPTSQPTAGHTCPRSRLQAFAALQAMALAAAAGELDAMVTGPVPKGIFDHLRPRPPGQTEYLAQMLHAERFAMMLAGPRLRVVPVTTHIALRDVAAVLTTQAIVDCALAAHHGLTHWLGIAAPRLAVCGLNPHAGEEGTLGDEEARLIAPALAQLQALGIAVVGPVVADTVFWQALQGHFDAVLCMYHDQALAPLKTVHFADAVNLTCGLPVARVSPDHGTAYALAGQGIADPTSMVAALRLAHRIGGQRLVGRALA